MDLPLTISAAVVFLTLALVFGWLGARPINVHLFNLLGVQTGNPPRY